jgi:hypothetical protein
MTAQELFDKLLSIREQFGTLDVPVSIWMPDADRHELAEVDWFTDGAEQHLHSIDINLKHKVSRFPNGFTNWHETHYEVVQAITYELMKEKPQGRSLAVQEADGHGGLYDLAKDLTDEFELANKDRQWDGDFFDAVEEFCNQKLK